MEPAVLLLLRERDSYGYELAGVLGRGGLVPPPVLPARIYEVLRRLEADGAVASIQEESPAGPDRYRYVLTPNGHVRLQRWGEALRLTHHSLCMFLTTSTTKRKEEPIMGCNCKCCGGSESEQQTEGQARAEREKQARADRIAQLEAELHALKSQESQA